MRIYVPVVGKCYEDIQGGSNMTGTDLCVNKCKQPRSYLKHLVCTGGREGL